MHCEKCGEKISEESVFCEFCGNKIQEEKGVSKTAAIISEENTKDAGIIQNENLKQISNHLEFLGYEVNKLDLGGEKEFISAKHSKNNNILIFELFPNFVMFKVSLTTQKKSNIKMDAYVNNANKNLLITKFYYDFEDSVLILRFEAVYVGKYVKEIFGQFHEIFENDQKSGCAFEDFSKLFVG